VIILYATLNLNISDNPLGINGARAIADTFQKYNITIPAGTEIIGQVLKSINFFIYLKNINIFVNVK